MELATLQDLQKLKEEVIEEIRSIQKSIPESPPRWVKSKKAKEILGCSDGTLNNYKQNGALVTSKLDDSGTVYYDLDYILKTLDKNKQNAS